MTALLPSNEKYHRPMNAAIVESLVTALAGATVPPTASDFRFPMSSASAAKVVAALNELDLADNGMVQGSVAAPFALSDGLTLKVKVDGAVVDTATFNGAAAARESTNGGPFAINNGETILAKIDGGVAQTATFATAAAAVAGGAEPYALVGGQTLIFDLQAVAKTVTFAATAATVLGSSGETYNITNGQTLVFNLQGVEKTVTFETADFVNIAAATAAEVAAKIAAVVGVTAVAEGGAVRVTSDQEGTGSSINVTGGTARATLGIALGEQTGTGDFVDAAAATAAEVAAVVTLVAGVTATDVAGAITITSDLVGTDSSINVTGGTARAALGLALGETTGTGDFADASAATATEVATALSAGFTGATATVTDTTKVTITSDLVGTDSGVEVTGGTANAAIAFATAAVAGTGDAANIAAVSFAEAKALIEGDIAGLTVTSFGGKLRVRSDTDGALASIQITNGTANAALGFTENQTAGAGLRQLTVDDMKDPWTQAVVDRLREITL